MVNHAQSPRQSVKDEILTNLQHYTPSELKRMLVDLLTRQRVGLYWERDLIAQDRALNENNVFVELIEHEGAKPRTHGAAPHRNLILEGDNFDALRLLRTTHAGMVRVILVDPPYNTGSKDFVYNDRFVRKDDAYRQSMWLDWLHRRLKLARDLLTPDGVIMVCINDEQRARLELLMDEVFAGMRVGSFVWKTRAGTNDPGDHFFSSDHEHILIYAMPGFRFAGDEKSDVHYRYDDNDGRGRWMSGDLTVTVRYDDPRAGNAYYPLHNPETDIWYPCDPDQVWRYASRNRLKPGQRLKTKTMEQWVADRKISFPTDERVSVWGSMEELLAAIDAGDVPNSNGRPLLRRGLPELEAWVGRRVGWGKPRFKRHWNDLKHESKPVTSWIVPKADSQDKGVEGRFGLSAPYTNEGTSKLLEIFQEKVFNYPKPITLVEALLNQASGPKDIVLDFFAGSGTTAEAVLKLNKEDGGERSFILVSSTEATKENPDRNLCRDVCAERVRRVIKGYGDGAGLGGEFAYLRLHKIAPADTILDMTAEMAWHSLCLIHGGFVLPYPGGRVSRIPVEGEAVVLFCPDTDDQTVAELRARGEEHLLVYTDRAGSVVDALAGKARVEVRDIFEAVQTMKVQLEMEG